MGAVCRGGGALAGVLSAVEPIGRRGPGCDFGVLGNDCVVVTGNDKDDRILPSGGEGACKCAMRVSVLAPFECEALTPFPSKILPHTSSSQLVVLATPFTPVVVGVPTPPAGVAAIVGPATRVWKSTVPPSFGAPLEVAFTSKPPLRSSILCESRRY
jgi:hypothetical protein